jgi:prepilin-type N-terminal cleavage/methylation domain-containing protein
MLLMITYKKSGFTLVELLVVIVVLSIVAGISTFAFIGSQQRSNDDARNIKATQISESLERYHQKNNEYPSKTTMSGTIAQLKALLGIKSDEVFTFPGVAAGTKSLTTSGSPSASNLVYDCANTSGGGNYCDTYSLSYKNEINDSTVIVTSRNK